MTQDPLLAANSNLQSLIHQVGILSEGLTEIKLMLREQADIARSQNQSISQLAEAQQTTLRETTAIVAAQNANISRLIEMLDRK